MVVIHGFNAVAELKAKRAAEALDRLLRHPRLQRRGRIEGPRGMVQINVAYGHPRLQRRGRIEGLICTGLRLICTFRKNP